MAQFRKDTHQYLADSKTIFEVVMLADQYGNRVGPANPSGMAVDAFGRARTSTPFTLFDSFHRYQDNGKTNTLTTPGGSYAHNAYTSMIEMTVDSTPGASVIRETNRVFAYQPGKSLQIFITFCMNSQKPGLRQRAGYFNTENGIFLQQADSTISLVKRTSISGSPTDVLVNQADWNMDRLDGTGPSGLTLDLTKSQIFFTDIEWLGVGSVRCGFVIDGQFIHVHSFHHSNIITTTYMTTACLPGRVEITNTGGMSGTATYKQACFTVISEGGYELRGRPKSIGRPVTAPKDIPTAGTFVPLLSIRLKSDRLDAIVLPKAISLLGIGNNTRLQYKIVSGATLTGASWTQAASDSHVEYDFSATAYTGGTDLTQGYVGITNQATQAVELKDGVFKYQLERSSLSNTATTFTLVATGAANGDDALASIDWEEIT